MPEQQTSELDCQRQSALAPVTCSAVTMCDRDMDYFHGHGRIEYNTPQWLFDALDVEFGFTVDAAASADNPVVLPVVADLAAGASGDAVVEAGTAVRIMTGAPLPRLRSMDIISVPPATTRSSMPDLMQAAARLTALMPDPQKRSIVMPLALMS